MKPYNVLVWVLGSDPNTLGPKHVFFGYDSYWPAHKSCNTNADNIAGYVTTAYIPAIKHGHCAICKKLIISNGELV